MAQGISDKARVRELHASEGEDALLWIDLEADHAAARYCEAVLGGGLVELKRLQLRALRDFPVGPEHRPSDRLRKSRRAADLAIDVAARERSLLASTEIAQILWPRGGGTAMVIAHGTYRRCFHTAPVTGRQVAVLDAAANEDLGGRRTGRLLRLAGDIFDGTAPATD